MSKLVRFWISVLVLLGVAITPAMAAAPQIQTVEAEIDAPSAAFDLTILHTNDLHAHVDQYNRNGALCTTDDETDGLCIAGDSRLQTLVEGIRAAETNVLLVDAGDQFQGTLFYNLYKADIVTATMNALGYEAMTVGNHEFDDGPAELARLADGASFPIVSANLNVSAEPLLDGKIEDYTIVTKGGEQIGIVGVSTPETKDISSPGPNVIFEDPVTSVQAAVNTLTGLGVDKIVVLSHLGYDQDLALAGAVSDVDVIVGGHSHTFIYTPTAPIKFYEPEYPQYDPLVPAGPYPTVVPSLDSEPVLVVTAFQWGTFLGRLDVGFDAAGLVTEYDGNPIYLSRDIVKSAAMETILDEYRPGVEALINTPVGTSAVNLFIEVAGARICRLGECLMGNLVADAMLWKANQMDPDGDYQIAFQNGGGLRAPIMAGPVTMGNVLETLPFGNTVATFELTGTHVITALEHSVRLYPSANGGFLQTSGLRYYFDPTLPAGSRITHVDVMSGTEYVPLDPNAVYKIVTNDFTRKGGDGYAIFRDYAINPYDAGPNLAEALAEYFGDFSPVAPEIEGRIQLMSLSTSTKTVEDDDGDGVASAGELLTYTITLKNTSEEGAAFLLTDTLPSGVTYVVGSLNYNGFPESTEITITNGALTAKTANFPALVDGGSFTINMPGIIRFSVTVDDPLPGGDEIVNQIELIDQDEYEYSIPPAVIPLARNYIYLPLVMRAYAAP